MAQTLTKLLVHIVFSTKDRRELITPDVQGPLYDYIGGICKHHESPLLNAGGVSDHVHLLVSQSKSIALAALVMHIKKDSSKWMKAHGVRDFAWQEGYAAITIGQSGVGPLRTYIANQERHHRRRTFKEELIEFLQKYEVDYDPTHMWS